MERFDDLSEVEDILRNILYVLENIEKKLDEGK